MWSDRFFFWIYMVVIFVSGAAVLIFSAHAAIREVQLH
jgi:hypothetical protein